MRVPTFLHATVLVCVVLILGCSGEKQEQAAQQNAGQTVTVSNRIVPIPDTAASDSGPTQMISVAPLANEDDQLVKNASEKLIDQFSVKLRGELTKAMAGGDAAQALEICSQKAPQLTQELTTGGFVIRRLSQMNRNQANFPEALDGFVMQKFMADTSLKYYAMWDTQYHRKMYRYYRPIYMQAMCTACHGKTEEMDPAVVERLGKLYPHDRAVGFKEGDLRGMFAVTADWPKAKPEAEKIVNLPATK